jgi:hypothetical protein
MKTIEVSIEGTTPLLMHGISQETMEQMMSKSRKQTELPSTEEAAERAAYRSADGGLYVPSRAVKACIVNASGWYKIGRKSAKQFLAGATRIEPYEIPLNTKKYEIDLRPVVVQRSRIIRARPRLDKWTITFNIVYNEKVLEPDLIKQVLEEAGQRIGLLDNRPQCGGECGTFVIKSWKTSK